MKVIIIKSNNSEITVDSNLSYYLFSYFFIAVAGNDCISKGRIITENKIMDLYNILEKYALEILKIWYKEPNEKELQKYSTRYERIKLKSKIYKVNYRMSEIGRLIFVICNILKMLDEAYINQEGINIRIEYIENIL
ncbi:hypothetical protein [Chryseobacterium arachidis]|nr:hypothetical protein [Chryseobacterium arachidis]